MEFRQRAGFTTTDGHRYVSVPAEVPVDWSSWYDEDGFLLYGCGDYLIVRNLYVGERRSYSVHRDVNGRLTRIGWPYSRLKDAKEKAVQNAKGLDVFNWA